MRHIGMHLIIILFALSPAASARAAERTGFTLISAALERSNVSAIRFVDRSIELNDAEGRTSKIDLDEVLAIDSQAVSDASSVPNDLWVAILSDGSRVGGVPLRLEGDQLRWHFQSGETSAELTFDLAKLKSIVRLSAQFDATTGSATEDVLRLRNGDVVTGIVDGITEQAISLSVDGKLFEASRDDVTELRLANVPDALDDDEGGFVIGLNDSSKSTLRVKDLQGKEDGVLLTMVDQSLTLDQSLIASLRNTGGRAKFLVDFKPISVSVLGYFASEGHPPRFNLPARSIETRSRTLITYDISGFDEMQTRFAVPAELDHANVTVRIRLDGDVAFEQLNVTSGTTSEFISLKLAPAKEMTLETDFGENFDVQDRLTWLEPVLAR